MNVLDVVVVPPRRPGGNYPTVRLRVDGQDRLGPGDRVGYDPEELLGSGALLPTDPPRRVGLYGCGCGVPSCSNVTAVIVREGDTVAWRDLANVVGSFDDPVDDAETEEVDDDDPFLLPQPLDLPDLAFDAEVYLATVRSAMADRGWETRARTVARLLGPLLPTADVHASHRGDFVEIMTRDPGVRTGTFRVPPGPPADAVDSLLRHLVPSPGPR